MLAAGVLLFVSAHWENLSPFQRITLLVLTVAGFHIAGACCSKPFRALGITMHAVGTISLGGAIFLAGQIFNMQEHWPNAVLLWGLGAIAGWLLLGDWPQLALAAILMPWYLVGEYTEAVSDRHGWQVAAAGILLLAICYLSARTPGSEGWDDQIRASLGWLGGLALLPAALAVALTQHVWHPHDLRFDLGAAGWAGAILIPLAVAYGFRRAAAWMNVVAALWVIGLSRLADQGMELSVYTWCVIGAAAMIGWGIYEFRAERINLGMAGFALTIVFFFFSSVMDKLGRSASLISLGALFVAGGWYWEKLRRGLVARVRLGGAQ